jgi:DNA-binding beta-propeller fold protein YncE
LSNFPYDVAATPSGDLFVTNAGDGTLVRVTASGGQGVVASGLPLGGPWGIARAADGNIYIGDTSATGKLLRFDPASGVLTTVVPGGWGDPYGVAAGLDGMVYVTSFNPDAIHRGRPGDQRGHRRARDRS